MKHMKDTDRMKMEQLLGYLLVACILSVSSLSLAAALLARDLFYQADVKLLLIGLLLAGLYLIGLLFLAYRQQTTHTKNMVRG